MTYSGNEVADGQNPASDAVKPTGYAVNTIRGEADIAAVAMGYLASEVPADDVAERDSAATPQKGRQKRQVEMQSASPDEITAKDEQRLVRDGYADNSEHQQDEQTCVTIVREPCEHRIHAAVAGYQPSGKVGCVCVTIPIWRSPPAPCSK